MGISFTWTQSLLYWTIGRAIRLVPRPIWWCRPGNTEGKLIKHAPPISCAPLVGQALACPDHRESHACHSQAAHPRATRQVASHLRTAIITIECCCCWWWRTTPWWSVCASVFTQG